MRFYITSFFILLILLSGNFIQSQDLDNVKNQKPVRINGNLSAHALFYGVDGIEARSKPFSYILSGNLNASIYGVDIPLSFTYSEKERDFRQPFNQFGLSPHYKWATLHLGYRSLSFSSFTLSGYSILGAGAELNPGKFRFGFIYGRFKRATNSSDIGQANPTPSYKRMGFATKIGYGTEKTFFDLILVKAKDDSTSLKPDSANGFLTPAENIVAGYNTKIRITKQLSFESEAALSVYTKNTRADTSVIFDSLEKHNFPVNSAKGLIVTNSTTEGNTAVRAALSYKAKYYSAKIQYKRISTNYTSMGTYYMNNDLQNITFDPAVSLFKQKMNLRGSIGLQNDNLTNKKSSTSLRTIGSVSFNYNPLPKFGIDGNFSNVSMNQKAGKLPLVDSTKIIQSNMNIMLTPRFIFANARRSHIIMLMYNFMQLNDKNERTQNLTNYNTTNIFLNYVLSLTAKNLSLSFGVNYTTIKFSTNTSENMGFTAAFSKSLLKNKLSLGIPVTIQNSQFQNVTSWVINVIPSLNYQLFKRHQFSLQAGYIGNFSDQAGQTFNEFKGDIGYTFTF